MEKRNIEQERTFAADLRRQTQIRTDADQNRRRSERSWLRSLPDARIALNQDDSRISRVDFYLKRVWLASLYRHQARPACAPSRQIWAQRISTDTGILSGLERSDRNTTRPLSLPGI